MTTDPSPDALLDELLSAELDGELAAAATEHGMTLDEARRLIERSPDARSRRAALEAARQALRVEPLDELTRRRFLAAATAAADHTDTPRRVPTAARPWPRVVAIAAALLLVVGVGAVIALDSGSDDAQDVAVSEGDAATAESADDTALGVEEFDGDVSDPVVLRGLLEGTAPLAESGAAPDAPSPAAEDLEPAGDGAFSGGAGTDDAAEDGASEPSPAARASSSDILAGGCLGAFDESYGAAPLRLVAARHDDRAALVVVFDLGGLTSAVVLDAETCEQLQFQSLR